MSKDRVYNEVLLPAFNKCLKEQFGQKKKEDSLIIDPLRLSTFLAHKPSLELHRAAWQHSPRKLN